jgi:hypothetical protein
VIGEVGLVVGGVVLGRYSKAVEFLCGWYPFCRMLGWSGVLVVGEVVDGVLSFGGKIDIDVDGLLVGIVRMLNDCMVRRIYTNGCC